MSRAIPVGAKTHDQLGVRRSRYWLLLPYLRHHWKTIAQALLCTAVFTLFWPFLAWIAGEMLGALAAGEVLRLAQLAGITTLLFLVQKLAQYGQDALMAHGAFRIAFVLRLDVYAHLQTLSLSFFETAKAGDLSYRLTEDVDRVGEVVNKLFHDFVPCVLQLVVVFCYMVYLNWQLTLATLVMVPLLAALIGWFGDRMLVVSRRSQNRVSDLSALVSETVSGMRIIQAFSAEATELERFRYEAERNRQAQYRTAWLRAVQFPVIGFLYAVSILLLLLLGGWQIAANNLTGAAFGSYVAAVLLLIDPIAHITDNYSQFKQGEASVDRVFELLALRPAVADSPKARPLPLVKGRVEYRNVSFGYGEHPVLNHLSLEVNPGDAIALVGPSGAGKTTLVNLLPRFYDPQGGQILIDGIDIRDVSLRSLRRQIGIVPQDTLLFSGTIAENIALGHPDADIEDVVAAATVANAHCFIQQFSLGYNTYVGERGVTLSGGQRQRLAIARAVLLDPRILILDEATSALDSESEALVQEALERLMHNRTVFIIAHRLATVRRSDRIVVVERGRIVETGTHNELLARGDRYAALHDKQFAPSPPIDITGSD